MSTGSRRRRCFAQRVLRQIEKIGLHDVEDRIRFEKIVTPDDWQNTYQVFRGATFNLAHNLGQMLHARPRNHFNDLKQVYLVGGGTHPGSGLPVIYESARISARMMCDALQLDVSGIPFVIRRIAASTGCAAAEGCVMKFTDITTAPGGVLKTPSNVPQSHSVSAGPAGSIIGAASRTTSTLRLHSAETSRAEHSGDLCWSRYRGTHSLCRARAAQADWAERSLRDRLEF